MVEGHLAVVASLVQGQDEIVACAQRYVLAEMRKRQLSHTHLFVEHLLSEAINNNRIIAMVFLAPFIIYSRDMPVDITPCNLMPAYGGWFSRLGFKRFLPLTDNCEPSYRNRPVVGHLHNNNVRS